MDKEKNEGKLPISTESILAHLVENGLEGDKEACEAMAGTESKTFTIKSTATVGGVTKTLVMRVRSAGGISTIFQYQFI